MPGVTDLQTMLQSMQPELLAEDFVFLTFKDATYGDHRELNPVASIGEKEGLTLVVSRLSADSCGQPYSSVFRCISLNVHSSLEATGLTAAFSAALADHGISCNVVAGFYHDHIFVPVSRSSAALKVLLQLSEQARAVAEN